MQTKVSTKGQVVLPGPIRRRLGLRPGDPLGAHKEGRIMLTPRRNRSRAGKIVTDPITGLPALSAGADAPVLSSKEVEEMMRSFS